MKRIVAKAKIWDMFTGVTSELVLEEQRESAERSYFSWRNDSTGELTACTGSTYDLAVLAAMQEWWSWGFKLTSGRAPVKPTSTPKPQKLEQPGVLAARAEQEAALRD